MSTIINIDGVETMVEDRSNAPSTVAENMVAENIGEVPMRDPKSGKLRSWVWEHFKRETINGKMKAICKYCKKQLVGGSNSGTSHLKEHYTKQHKSGALRQKLLTNNFNRDRPLLSTYAFDEENARKELARAIIMHEYPLSIVDHLGFKRYSASLQPLFKLPCRNTIKKVVLNIYDYEKVKTLSLVEGNQSRLAITTDMWTSSNQKKGFMAVTAHFIDDSWSMQSRILRYFNNKIT